MNSDNALAQAFELYSGLKSSCESKVQGRSEVIDLILIALLSDGHVLLEDHPGSGKTTLAKALGDCIDRGTTQDDAFASFRRIQFTPDLLPSDVTGTTVFDPDNNRLVYRPGPVFANVVLADEINRTSPKVQASMLEAMAEKQVTVDNATHGLEDLFLVIATQNPLDQVGTYPLPAAQLDRFLFKVQMTYLSREAELEVLANKYPHCQPETSQTRDVVQAAITASPADIVTARTAMQHNILVNPKIQEALVDIAVGLRNDPRIRQGLSTRSLVVAIPALQARALTQGRDFVSPDDVKALSTPIFKHRLELMPGVSDANEVIEDVMAPIMEAIA